MASVELRNIEKAFGKVSVIKGVNLSVKQGEFVVFVGPSGCGKSTLLRLIAGLEDANSGDLLMDGQRVNLLTPKERGIGMVFQSYALYPHMTVYDNIAFGLQLAKTEKHLLKERVLNTAKILQLENLLDRKPKQLSGGQRQRVAMGRAMAREPSILLFDEPLSNLDAALRVQMRTEIKKLHQRLGSTMIYVTHDQVEAMTLADKIVVLNEGRIEQTGTPFELYESPASVFVAGFIGSPKMNLLQGKIISTDGDLTQITTMYGATINLPIRGSEQQPGDEVVIGVRPENTRVVASNDQPLTIVNREYLGNESFIYLAQEDSEDFILVRESADTPLQVGMPVKLVLNSQQCHIFAENGRALT